jgi:hypothetical protein
LQATRLAPQHLTMYFLFCELPFAKKGELLCLTVSLKIIIWLCKPRKLTGFCEFLLRTILKTDCTIRLEDLFSFEAILAMEAFAPSADDKNSSYISFSF